METEIKCKLNGFIEAIRAHKAAKNEASERLMKCVNEINAVLAVEKSTYNGKLTHIFPVDCNETDRVAIVFQGGQIDVFMAISYEDNETLSHITNPTIGFVANFFDGLSDALDFFANELQEMTRNHSLPVRGMGALTRGDKK